MKWPEPINCIKHPSSYDDKCCDCREVVTWKTAIDVCKEAYSRQEKLVPLDEGKVLNIILEHRIGKLLKMDYALNMIPAMFNLSQEICAKFGQEKGLDYTAFFHIIEKIIDTHIEYFSNENIPMIEAEGIYHETSIKEAYQKLFGTKSERSW